MICPACNEGGWIEGKGCAYCGHHWYMEKKQMTVDYKDKEAVKKAWIEALESGKYQQTQSTLALIPDEGVGFCCIGVLGCVVNGEMSYRGAWGYNRTVAERQEAAKHFSNDKWDVSEALDGYTLAIKLFGYVNRGKFQSMNDTQKLSFAEIAQWIKENC